MELYWEPEGERFLQLHIEERPEKLLLLRVSGSFDEYTTDWMNLIASRIERIPMDMVMSLAGVDYIDSKGLGSLFDLHKRLEEIECHLYFSSLSTSVHDVFDVAGLMHILNIYESEEKAVEALHDQRKRSRTRG